MDDFTDRMIRAAKLDVSLYEEVEEDKSAMGQAFGVVVLSSIAAGVGTFNELGIAGMIQITFAALIAWYVWAYIIYYVGTRLLPEPQTRSNPGELLRTTGFSSSPGVIRLMGFIPGVGTLLFFVAHIWMLITMVIAIRQALDFSSTGRAVGVCLVGWIIQAVVMLMIFFLFGGTLGQIENL